LNDKQKGWLGVAKANIATAKKALADPDNHNVGVADAKVANSIIKFVKKPEDHQIKMIEQVAHKNADRR
jgi:hypothetical protein